MKNLLLLPLLIVLFASCRTSNEPNPSIPAVMPHSGAEFVYEVDAPQGTFRETARITHAANDSFTVVRTSDTVNGFSTSGTEHYVLRSSGDLFRINSEPLCDTFPLPIATHHDFSGPNGGFATPTKANGFVDTNSDVIFATNYEGVGSIAAAGTSFIYTRVSETITVMAESGQPPVGGIDTERVSLDHWYSSELGFFVKDRETNRIHDHDSVTFTRTLVSF